MSGVQDYFRRHQAFKDALGIIIFVLCVLVGTLLINTFLFRSFNVEGGSSWPTLKDGDRLIVNRIPVTISQLQNKTYIPDRGQFIVFKNPQYDGSGNEEYIVKRVIAFPGERVVVNNGTLTVYNTEHPTGFHPDDAFKGEPGKPTSGEVDEIVPTGTLFVVGDHRQGENSFDSRNGLGTVPFYDIVGPVSIRLFPFNHIRTF